MTQRPQSQFIQNLGWFAVSFLLALFVWATAALQSNPINQRVFNNIPVQIEAPSGVILTSPSRVTARVFVRAQQSVLDLLTSDDIVVRTDISKHSAGVHTVPLNVTVNRSGAVSTDTQPTQLTIVLEQVKVEQKSVTLVVTNPPPIDYTYEEPTADVLQAQVSGALNQVLEVVEIRGEVDLNNQRNPFTGDISLFAVDINGKRVTDVTIEPRTTRVQASIYPRDDVRQLSVRPNITIETLTEGYVLTKISYEPQTVFVSGALSDLVTMGATLDTIPISLKDFTRDFSVDVPLDLPDNVLLIGTNNTVTVNIGISAQTTVRQFDNVPVEYIGLTSGYSVTFTPNTISVVLSGSIANINSITSDDINAIIDLNNIGVGNKEIAPRIVIQQGELVPENITPLPAVITVNIMAPTPTNASPTPTASRP